MTDLKPDEPDWRFVMGREEARRAHDRADDFFKQVNEAAIKTGESTFRACLLINGGAAVSVLAFIGSLASKDVIGGPQIAAITDSLISFAAGVVTAVAGMALSYLVNYLTAEQAGSLAHTWEHPWIVAGKHTGSLGWLKAGLHVLTVLVGVASMVFFFCGILAVRNSVEHIPQAAPPATHTQAPSAKSTP
jgi:hypothetical protein